MVGVGNQASSSSSKGVGNQASSSSSKNTLRTICTSTKVEIVLLVPGHPGTTPSYAPNPFLTLRWRHRPQNRLRFVLHQVRRQSRKLVCSVYVSAAKILCKSQCAALPALWSCTSHASRTSDEFF